MFNASTLWPVGCLLMAAFLIKTGSHLMSQMHVSLFYKLLTASHYLGTALVLFFVFALFATWYSWMVQKLDIPFSEVIGRLHFWVTLIGVLIIYVPGYLIKMPRIITSEPTPIFSPFFLLTNAVGMCLVGAGFVLFFRGLYKALSA